MFDRFREESGLTIFELMVVLAIIGIIVAVGTYNFYKLAPKYRLRSSAGQVASNLQYIKMRAIATNRTSWFYIDNTNRYFTGFVDVDADGIADNPGDYNQSKIDFTDNVGGIPGIVLPPDVSFGWPTSYTGTGPDGVSPGADTDGFYVAGDASDNEVGFRPTGIPVVDLATQATPTENIVVYLKNGDDDGFAVSIAVTGNVRIWQWTGTGWK